MSRADVKGNYFNLSKSQIKAADAIGQVADIGGQVASGIISAVGAAKNKKLQDQINADLEKLDTEQMKALGDKLTIYADADAKLEAMMKFFSEQRATQGYTTISSTITNRYMAKANKDRKTMYLAFGGAIAFLFIIVLIKKLKK
jgi:ribosomal protein S13